ncbi:FtSH [Dehalogenimonas sp. WBC-2]|nr:FtSH [Dehalogenimonas sp. WBC-2]
MFINELFRIVNGALRLDLDKVRNYTEFLADRLEKEGDPTSAGRLRKLLVETDNQLRPASIGTSKTLPIDAESRFPLIEHVNLRAINDAPVILEEAQWEIIYEFLSIAKSHGQLDAEGIGGSVSLLMCGPPGTGKSRLARLIAQQLGLGLYIARLDGLVSSFLGSTSKNIRALFDFAARTPCVLFLDEFDAIAKIRSDTQEMGELKRVVNSFIQNLDSFGPQSIILAATNHEGLLDAAVWRRFTYRLELGYPSFESRTQMWEQFMPPLDFNEHDVKLLVDLSEGFSGSDIQEVCRRLKRRRVVTKENPTLNDAFQVLQNLGIGEGENRRFLSQLKGMGPGVVAQILQDRNKKLYGKTALARLLGVTRSTIYRRMVMEEKQND